MVNQLHFLEEATLKQLMANLCPFIVFGSKPRRRSAHRYVHDLLPKQLSTFRFPVRKQCQQNRFVFCPICICHGTGWQIVVLVALMPKHYPTNRRDALTIWTKLFTDYELCYVLKLNQWLAYRHSHSWTHKRLRENHCFSSWSSAGTIVNDACTNHTPAVVNKSFVSDSYRNGCQRIVVFVCSESGQNRGQQIVIFLRSICK